MILKLFTPLNDAVQVVTALNEPRDAENMNDMFRRMVVPMKFSGNDLAMHCCQIAPAVKRIVIEKLPGALYRLIL